MAVWSVGKKPVSRHDGLSGRWLDGSNCLLDRCVDGEKGSGEGNVVG